MCPPRTNGIPSTLPYQGERSAGATAVGFTPNDAERIPTLTGLPASATSCAKSPETRAEGALLMLADTPRLILSTVIDPLLTDAETPRFILSTVIEPELTEAETWLEIVLIVPAAIEADTCKLILS